MIQNIFSKNQNNIVRTYGTLPNPNSSQVNGLKPVAITSTAPTELFMEYQLPFVINRKSISAVGTPDIVPVGFKPRKIKIQHPTLVP